MKIGYHGGKCCGIKTIYNFPESPSSLAEGINKTPDVIANPDADRYGYDVSTTDPCLFRTGAAIPVETAEKRLKRFVEYIDKWRPEGIIEVVLAKHPDYTYGEDDCECDYDCECDDDCDCDCLDSSDYIDQVTRWEPVLVKLGFNLVSRCLNSNTTNECFVYHRYSVRKSVEKPQPAIFAVA